MDDDDHEDLDDLTRDELAERDGPGHAVAAVLDEWNQRLHGVTSRQHGAGLFLDLLLAQGWRVERADTPRLEQWLPVPGAAEPVRISYVPRLPSAEEIERARAAVLESVSDVLSTTTSVPMPDTTGPQAYQRLRELGVPDEDVAHLEAKEREEAARLAADREWARAFLVRCGIDPDDAADVRGSFEASREGYIAWRTGAPSEIDEETYLTLVYAIRAALGWVHWPLDWPAPYLALMSRPLRNLLPRVRGVDA